MCTILGVKCENELCWSYKLILGGSTQCNSQIQTCISNKSLKVFIGKKKKNLIIYIYKEKMHKQKNLKNKKHINWKKPK